MKTKMGINGHIVAGGVSHAVQNTLKQSNKLPKSPGNMGEIASDIKHVLLFTLCMCFLQPCCFL
jgi:hypothetical protein